MRIVLVGRDKVNRKIEAKEKEAIGIRTNVCWLYCLLYDLGEGLLTWRILLWLSRSQTCKWRCKSGLQKLPRAPSRLTRSQQR